MATTRISSAGKVSFGSWESEKREHPQGCSFFCALSSARGFCSPKGLFFYFSRTVRECALRGIFSFLGKRISPFDPQEKGIRLAVSGLNDLGASGMKACARLCRVGHCYTIWPTSITRCRSADLVGVQTNSHLPPVSSMRRAQQCRIRHAVCRRGNVTRASR